MNPAIALDKLEIKLPSGFSFNMIFVEGGNCDLGEGREIHNVTLPSFYISEYLVTQALWKEIMDGEVHQSYFQGGERPKTDISWDDITKLFLPNLRALTGKPYRLPSEAEWEYAARGGNKSEGFEYAGSNNLKEVGWHYEHSYGETKAVGLKYPNELGLYDMSGNVWEWCEDDWHVDYENAPDDGSAWIDKHKPKLNHNRVQLHRGGSYIHSPEFCRVAFRFKRWPGIRLKDLGFRLALSPSSTREQKGPGPRRG